LVYFSFLFHSHHLLLEPGGSLEVRFFSYTSPCELGYGFFCFDKLFFFFIHVTSSENHLLQLRFVSFYHSRCLTCCTLPHLCSSWVVFFFAWFTTTAGLWFHFAWFTAAAGLWFSFAWFNYGMLERLYFHYFLVWLLYSAAV
jgi:hypothetical protein